MKLFFAMTSIALMATPAHAGLRWPSLAGSEYCELRSAGVDHDSAMQAAIDKGVDPDFDDRLVTIDGEYFSIGSVKMLLHIKNSCRQLHPKL